MTIPVLDDAMYAEVLFVRNRSTQAGLILEAPKHATLTMPPAGTLNLTILNVLRVQVRGFRLQAKRGGTFGIGVGGQSAGVTLEGLDFRADDPNTYAVTVEGLSLGSKDAPLTIRGCTFAAYGTGVQIVGKLIATGKESPCRGILVHSCKFADCQRVFRFTGVVNDVALMGNTLSNCATSGFEFEGPMPGSGRIFIANNSMMNPHHSLVINDPLPDMPEVVVQSNLVLTERGPDLAFLGKDPKSYAGWLIIHNWRQVTVPSQPGPDWILPPKDKVVGEIRVLSRDPAHADFLRPPADSPLASGGAGGELPTYVGAVPPRGALPWDWQKTWNARGAKLSNVGKTGKD